MPGRACWRDHALDLVRAVLSLLPPPGAEPTTTRAAARLHPRPGRAAALRQAADGRAQGVQAGGRREVLADVQQMAPPTILAQASRLQFSTRLFNLIVTNVPGPQFPIYMLGREMLNFSRSRSCQEPRARDRDHVLQRRDRLRAAGRLRRAARHRDDRRRDRGRLAQLRGAARAKEARTAGARAGGDGAAPAAVAPASRAAPQKAGEPAGEAGAHAGRRDGAACLRRRTAAAAERTVRARRGARRVDAQARPQTRAAPRHATAAATGDRRLRSRARTSRPRSSGPATTAARRPSSG